MNINDLYNELADSLDDFRSLLKKPSMRSPEVVKQLLLLTVELVKAIELNRCGHQDKLPAHLVDNVEESRVALNNWLNTLEVSSDSTDECYIKEFVIHEGKIERLGAKLIYNKVEPIFEKGKAPIGFTPKGSCFLYEDYSCMLKPGDTFYEIVLINVEEQYRRNGVGTRIVKEFFSTCNPKTVVLRAGITDKELYDKLHQENRIDDYIYENIVPFYEKLGFTDVNHTVFCFEESVPMLWPKAIADEAKRKSEEFRRQREQERYRLDDFLVDPQILIAVMEKHGNYVQWFKDNFPNGALYKGEVLKKLSEE